MAKGALIHEVDAGKFLDSLATKLMEIPEFKMPNWAEFVKTGAAKERLPQSNDWWYKRAASILRKLYVKGVIGVERLSAEYSHKKNRGVKPERVYKGGRKIIRAILQQAEAAGFVEKRQDSNPGRQLTKNGLVFLNKVVSEVRSS